MDRQTVRIYEEQSERYEARRSPRFLDDARAFAGLIHQPGLVADLGSGPGWYTAALGPATVALDAAEAMLRRTRQVAPETRPVRADLAALPFRRGALAGGWARNTYVHLASADVPLALAELHRALGVDAPVMITFLDDEAEGRTVFPDDDLPGRFFSTWSAQRLEDVVVGAGFVIDELTERGRDRGELGFTVRAHRGRTLSDTVRADMRVLVCGLNPSIHAADAGIGFVTPGNRFWPAALEAGLVTRDRDPIHALRTHGVGMTDLVKRATPRADALTAAEHRAGLARVDRLCEWLRPTAVGIVGLAGWRAAVDRQASPGWQSRRLGPSPVYLLPSTSGLNAGTRAPELVDHLRAVMAGRPNA